VEILVSTPALANLIREGKTHQIPTVIQTGKREGMMSLDEGLMDLLRRQAISAEEAYRAAIHKETFARFVF